MWTEHYSDYTHEVCVGVRVLKFEEDNKALSLSTAPQYSHIISMTFCLSTHGGGRRQMSIRKQERINTSEEGTQVH